MQDGLRNQTAIKRISVMLREQGVVGRAGLVKSKGLDLQPLPPAGHILRRSLGEGQSSEPVLDADLPG
jgi:hypothetical protein